MVLPGWGAFIGAYRAARFAAADGEADTDGYSEVGAVADTLLPPSVALCFNEALSEQDGLVAHSVARREGISYEAACQQVAADVDLLRHQLEEQGEVAFGRLGTFRKAQGEPMVFEPSGDDTGVNARFFGLKPVKVTALAQKAALTAKSAEVAEAAPTSVVAGVQEPARGHKESTQQGGEPGREERLREAVRTVAWRRYAAGVAASVAVIVSLGLWVFSPAKVEQQSVTASLAPVPSARIAETAHTAAAAEDVPMVLTVALPPQADTGGQEAAPTPPAAAAKAAVARMSDADPYVLVVASLPTRELAEKYMSDNRSRRLGVVEQDGRFRVYAATGATQAQAEAQKDPSRDRDAWVTRR